jgi:hypothetical protein
VIYVETPDIIRDNCSTELQLCSVPIVDRRVAVAVWHS